MAKPLYQLFHADAFEWLAGRRAKTIHAVVTDPPYGIVEYTLEQLEKRRNGNGGIWRIPRCMDGHVRNPSPRFTVLRPVDYQRIIDFIASSRLSCSGRSFQALTS